MGEAMSEFVFFLELTCTPSSLWVNIQHFFKCNVIEMLLCTKLLFSYKCSSMFCPTSPGRKLRLGLFSASTVPKLNCSPARLKFTE